MFHILLLYDKTFSGICDKFDFSFTDLMLAKINHVNLSGLRLQYQI